MQLVQGLRIRAGIYTAQGVVSMLMTMGEFAEEYGVTRNYVNYAVKMAKLQPVERGPMVYGHSAGMYEERDLANAVKNYYIGLRDNIRAKAERWHNEALGVKRHYERRHRHE
jgi:hypothetical protein